jgi:diguanylate cyclase (GGDEF)-like protein
MIGVQQDLHPARRHDDLASHALTWPIKVAVATGACAAIFAVVASLCLMRLADGIEKLEQDMHDIAALSKMIDSAALYAQRFGASGGAHQDDRRIAEQSWSEAERTRAVLVARSGGDPALEPLLATLSQAVSAERLAIDHIWSALDAGEAGHASDFSLGAEPAAALVHVHDALNAIEQVRADDLRSSRDIERNWLLALLAMFTSSVLVVAGSAWLTWKKVVAAALRSAATQERLKRLAFRDPLTRLANRRVLDESFQRAREFADRTGEGLYVVAIDLNRFKEVNDRYGHHAGDHVLVEVARRLRTVCGDFDTVARSGGDEFIVLLQNTARIAESEVIWSLRNAVNRPTEFNGDVIHVSASIGVARYPRDGSTLATLCEFADQYMYHDKAVGKGRPTGFSQLQASFLER